jgi:hypothetical protein
LCENFPGLFETPWISDRSIVADPARKCLPATAPMGGLCANLCADDPFNVRMAETTEWAVKPIPQKDRSFAEIGPFPERTFRDGQRLNLEAK